MVTYASPETVCDGAARLMRTLLAVFALLAVVSVTATDLDAAPMTAEQAAKSPGAHLFKRKNCMACHKWHGLGGTGYGATPVNLRETPLTRDQIVEVIACGRPGTAMPYHLKTAYTRFDCYDGMKKEDLGEDQQPSRARAFMSLRNIRQVADFITDYFKTHPQVTSADCEIFFGVGARVCKRIDTSSSSGH